MNTNGKNSFFTLQNDLYIILFTFVFLLLSLFVHRSEVCCAFSSVRYYGWPNSFITISKMTDSYEDAQKIEMESMRYLLAHGWEVKFAGYMSDGKASFFLNFLLYLAISFALVFFAKKFILL